MKAPGLETGEIDIKDESEMSREAERIIAPEFPEIERVEVAIFQDSWDIVELENAREGVGVGRDPKEQDQEKTGACG